MCVGCRGLDQRSGCFGLTHLRNSPQADRVFRYHRFTSRRKRYAAEYQIQQCGDREYSVLPDASPQLHAPLADGLAPGIPPRGRAPHVYPCCILDAKYSTGAFGLYQRRRDYVRKVNAASRSSVFVPLKAIRNLAHHQEELRSNVRVIPTPAYSDLAMMCVVRRDQVEHAIEATPKRWREETRAACEAVFHWYGSAVNINPCVFNFMVRVYEKVSEVGVRPAEEDIAEFETSYHYEAEHGHSHYVDGKLSAPAGEISSILENVVAQMPAPT